MGVKDFFKDCITDLGVEVVKDKIHNAREEKQVRDRISAFIDSEYTKNINVSKEEEIDIEGLFDYLKNNYNDDIKARLTESNSKLRGEKYDMIMHKAVDYASANTNLSKQKAMRIVRDAIDILRDYYKKKANFELKFIVNEGVIEVINTIKDESEAMQKQIQDSNILSPVTVAKNIREGKLDQAAIVLSQSQSIINDSHQLNPYYGFTIFNRNGSPHLLSVPLTPEAEIKYPPHFSIVPSEISVDNRPVKKLDTNVFKYSYNHQLPIKINIKEVIKYLGNIVDPSQYEAEELVGKHLEIRPREFPPAFPCSLAIDDKVYFDYLLLRTREILDDGTIIIDNSEQKNRPFIAEFMISIHSKTIKINLKALSDNHKNCLQYYEFANKASFGGELVIKALDANEKLVFVHLNNRGDGEKYLNEIDILRKVIILEDYFGTDINIPEEFSMNDYDCLTWLSELIANGPTKHNWTEYSLTFDLAELKKNTLLNSEDIPYDMKLTLPFKVKLFDLNNEIVIERTINDIRIKDLDKVKRKVKVLDEDDFIKVNIIPNPDNKDTSFCVDKIIKDVS